MRGKLYILTATLAGALAALSSAQARPGGRGGRHAAAHIGAGPHHHPPPRHHPPRPPPQGWAKVGKHVYTSATWRGGQRGAWGTDVPF